MDNTLGGGTATGLGITVLRLFCVAQSLEWEAKWGFPMVKGAPHMSTLIKRDYGLTIDKSPEGKREAATLFYALAQRLREAIERKEDRLPVLEATVHTNGREFLQTLMWMLD